MSDRRPGRAAGEQGDLFDVAVIGGGVVGCAVLRELSRFDLRLLLLEKELDVAEGTSKANSGVIHAGFNVPPGSLKAKLNVAGLGKIYELARDLGVPHRKTGKLVVALEEADFPRLEELKSQGDRNGTPDLDLIDGSAIRALEPGVRGLRALYSPHTGIISPYEFTIALAESAHRNGAKVLPGAGLTGVVSRPGVFLLHTRRGDFRTQWVVNSAGLYADAVASMAGLTVPRVYPYRGEYLVADKEAGSVLRTPIYPVPPKDDSFLGVHITPTLEGNVLLGPSSECSEKKDSTGTTAKVLERLKAEAYGLVPGLERYPFIHAYAGLRPKLVRPDGHGGIADFLIRENPDLPGWIDCLGIESPGLTAAPAIARIIADMIGSRRDLKSRMDFDPGRPATRRFAHMEDAERERLVRADPASGEMVCRCEQVTRAEVVAALRNPFGAVTMDAIKRRTRCGMGRCQGGFCTPRIVDILEAEGVPVERMAKRGPGSELFAGRIRI
jgi:glycerol-3-phosphate dehydrogenase